MLPLGKTLELTMAGPVADAFTLNHNLPGGHYVVQFYSGSVLPDLVVFVPGPAIQVWLQELNTSLAYKVVALQVADGFSEGVWWVDRYVYDPLQVNIEFTSAGQGLGDGDPGSFSGSVLVAGAPAERTVFATAIDADVPFLLAQAVSDEVSGQYTLEWSGYSGQILITVMDDYGVPHVQGDARGSGERIHPTVPNGYVYDVSAPGELGVEPEWPLVDGAQVSSGTVQLVAVPFYKPQTQGPFSV